MSHLTENQRAEVQEMQRQVRYLQKGLFDINDPEMKGQTFMFD